MVKKETWCFHFGESVQRKAWREQRLSGFLKDLAWTSYPGKTLTQVNIWGRQQLTRWGDLLIFFDAYNANPESMKEFLEVVSEVPYRKKV